MKTFINEEVTRQVFEAIQDLKKLPLNEWLLLEYLSSDQDGIFTNIKSWNSFISGNFIENGYFISELKQSTIKKWCYSITDYKNLFVTKISADKFISVNSEDLIFIFDYEIYYDRKSNAPRSVEIFVKAEFK